MTEIAEILGVTRQALYKRLNAEREKQLVYNLNNQKAIAAMSKMGNENVEKFIAYHMAMLNMRKGVDKKNVPDLYRRFAKYLGYCSEHNIVPGNMNAYLAIGVSQQDISAWHRGVEGNAAQKEFADTIMAFFASVHEQGGTDGVLNPISAMFWQKAHDGLSDQPKVEVTVTNPLGEKKSAEDIAAAYDGVDLPD